MKPEPTRAVLMVEGIEGIPSVWIEQGSRGEIRYGVKVYHPNVNEALRLAKEAYTSVATFAKKQGG